jgi:hypothetical protein
MWWVAAVLNLIRPNNLLLHGRGKASNVSDERLSAKEEHNLPSE